MITLTQKEITTVTGGYLSSFNYTDISILGLSITLSSILFLWAANKRIRLTTNAEKRVFYYGRFAGLALFLTGIGYGMVTNKDKS